jgi:outer membrane cobalamin receptor
MAFSVLCSPFSGYAQDSVRARTVEVQARRDSIDMRRSVIDRTVVSAQEIRAKAPYQLEEVLAQVPGLFVKQYGGFGGISTVSVRGGGAAQTLVLLDGVRLNTVQGGQVDLSTVPLSFLRRIDVRRGALGAVDGANAMTGSIDLRLAVPEQVARVEASAGWFDSWKGALQGAWHGENAAVGGALELMGSAGSYPYTFTNNGETVSINRANARLQSATALLRAEMPAGWTATVIGRNADRGVPGAVVEDVVTQTRAHFAETDVLAQTGGNLFYDGISTLRVDAAFRYLDQHYTDPDATITGPGGVDARFLGRDAAGYLTWTSITGTFQHRASLNAGFADLRGNSLQPEVGSYVKRQQLGLGYTLEWNTERVVAQASLRAEIYSDVPDALAGGLGFAWLVDEQLTLRANLGTGYRPPTFNELYFLNYGNINLKPERSVMASVGTRWMPMSWLACDVSTFASHIADLIVSVPLSPLVTSANNVGAASSFGVEAAASASLLDDRLHASWSYTVQDVRDRTGRPGIDGTPIVYVPVEMIGATAEWREAEVLGRVEWSYTSHRYAQAGGETTSLLASYHLFNAGIGARLDRASHLVVQLRMDNVFDVRYEVVRGYPMPGSMLRVMLEASW